MKLPIHGELVAAFEARDAARIASLYAEDARFFTPGRAVAEGRAAIHEVMVEDLQDQGFSLELSDPATILAGSGDFAYTRGTFRASFTNPGTGTVDSIGGYYLQVLGKQDDGSWKIVEDISSPGAAGS